ncbi:unnamed protein product, partial [marine sediment metagenome]
AKNKEKIRMQQKEYYIEKGCRNPKFIYRNLFNRNHTPVKMTGEEFVSLYNSKPKACCYCGIPEDALKYMDYIPENRRNRLQIERIDNNKNYELNNIDLACHTCNIIHQNPISPKEVREIAQKYITPVWKKILEEKRSEKNFDKSLIFYP